MEMKDILKKIKPLMKAKGFHYKGKLFYHIQDNIACCIEFEQPSHLIYLAFYILPLYMSFENRGFTYGRRISINPEITDLRSHHESNDIEIFCETFFKLLDKTVFPFFQKASSPEKIVEIYENCTDDNFFACTPVDKIRLYCLTYAFLRNKCRSIELANQYRFALDTAEYYTKAVKEKYYLEVEFVKRIFELSGHEIVNYYEKVAMETLRKCFEGQGDGSKPLKK